MKKLMILAAMIVSGFGVASAQNYIVVNTETIFKAVPAYNKAVTEIDATAKQYQKTIDDAYAQLEDMYSSYVSQKASLSQSAQQQREETILNNEKKISEYQEAAFGTDGKIEKMQEEKLEPMRKKVMETITKYAKEQGYGLVLDISTNPMVMYYDPNVDKTQQIISFLK